MEKKRFINLDFIRGFCVILAIVEHTMYYNNTFFIDFDGSSYPDVISNYVKPLMNTLVPLDKGNMWMLTVFMMWVSHIYILLSAFNLAKRKKEDFNLSSKLKIFGTLFLIFSIESFIVGSNFGEMITLHPLLTWMILLSMISIIYKYFDIIGVIFFYIIAFLMTYFANDLQLGNAFEHIIQVNIHKEYLYDARLENFAITSITGFLLGYFFHHWNSSKKYLYGFGIAAIFILIAKILNHDIYYPVAQSMFDNFRNEGLYYVRIANILYIQSILVFITTLLLFLESKNIIINIRFLNYVSINSLFIFAVHKIFIVKMINPLRLVINSYTGWEFTNSIYASFSYSFIVVAMVWLILKLKIPMIITKSEEAKPKKEQLEN